MTLLKTSLLNGIAVLIRLVTQLLLTKIFAIYVGPSGFGVVGQFQNLVTMATSVASGAVNLGVTKYTAEYSEDDEIQTAVWVTAGIIGIFGVTLVGSALVLFREPISILLFGNKSNTSIFVWLALSLGFIVFNGLMLAILNGRKAIGALVTANIIGSFASALISIILVTAMGLKGALLAVCTSQSIACLFTALLFRRECSGAWQRVRAQFDNPIARKLGGYALMAITTAVVGPLTLLVIRNHIVNTLGWSNAGIWQALWKISDLHLLLITSTLSVYFLPRFSEVSDASELRREVFASYRFVLPIVILSSLAMFLFRDRLIHATLSAEFLQVANLLGVQLVGDILKVGGWVMGFTMISRARTRAFIFTEVIFSALLVASSIIMINAFGLRGVTFAYVLTYALYWLTLHILFNATTRHPPALTIIDQAKAIRVVGR